MQPNISNFAEYIESLKLFKFVSRDYVYEDVFEGDDAFRRANRFAHRIRTGKEKFLGKRWRVKDIGAGDAIYAFNTTFMQNIEQYFTKQSLSKNTKKYYLEKNTEGQNVFHLLCLLKPFLPAEESEFHSPQFAKGYCCISDMDKDAIGESKLEDLQGKDAIQSMKPAWEKAVKEIFPSMLSSFIQKMDDKDLLNLCNSKDIHGNTPLHYFFNNTWLAQNTSILLDSLIQRFKDKNRILEIVLNQDAYGRNLLFKMLFPVQDSPVVSQDLSARTPLTSDLLFKPLDELFGQDEKSPISDPILQKAKVSAINATGMRVMPAQLKTRPLQLIPLNPPKEKTQDIDKNVLQWTVLDEACYRSDATITDAVCKVLGEEGTYMSYKQRRGNAKELTALSDKGDFNNKLMNKLASEFKEINPDLTEIYFNLDTRRGDKKDSDYDARLSHFQNLLGDLMGSFTADASLEKNIKPSSAVKPFPKFLAKLGKPSIYQSLSNPIFNNGVTPRHLFKFINFLKSRADWQPAADEILKGITSVDQFIAEYNRVLAAKESSSLPLPSAPSLSGGSSFSSSTTTIASAPSLFASGPKSEQKSIHANSSVSPASQSIKESLGADKTAISNHLIAGLAGFLAQLKAGNQQNPAGIQAAARDLFNQLSIEVPNIVNSPISTASSSTAELLNRFRLQSTSEADLNTTQTSSHEESEPGNDEEGVPNPNLKK